MMKRYNMTIMIVMMTIEITMVMIMTVVVVMMDIINNVTVDDVERIKIKENTVYSSNNTHKNSDTLPFLFFALLLLWVLTAPHCAGQHALLATIPFVAINQQE